MKEKIRRAYRYSIKVGKEQEKKLYQWSGTCRYLWNRSLRLRERLYNKYGVSINYTGCQYKDGEKTKDGLNKRLTTLRARYEWINESPNMPQQEVLRDLDKAFNNFFRRVKMNSEDPGYPKFKNKRIFPRLFFARSNKHIEILDGKRAYVKIPKLGKVRIIFDRAFDGEVKSVAILNDKGKWFISVNVEVEIDIPEARGDAVGIDMGVVQTYALSDEKIYNIDYETIKNLQKRKEKLDRRISRRKGSKKGEKKSRNWIKLNRQINKITRKMSDIRKNFNHHTSKDISEQYSCVVTEKLKIDDMTKSAKGTKDTPGKDVKKKVKLNRSILQQGWGQFKSFLEYKCYQNGVELVEVDPHNTSRTCRKCGMVSKDNRKTRAIFKCIFCGHTEDADIHAAKYILSLHIHREVPREELVELQR